MHDFENKRTVVSTLATATGSGGPIVFTGTGDKFIISPSNPIQILRWGIIWGVAKDASNMVVTLETRVTAGSDTGRVVSDTMTDALGRLIGTATERKLTGTNPNSSTGSDGSLVNVASGGPITILPGQQAVFKVGTAAGSTGQGYIYAEYVEKPALAQISSSQSLGLNYVVAYV